MRVFLFFIIITKCTFFVFTVTMGFKDTAHISQNKWFYFFFLSHLRINNEKIIVESVSSLSSLSLLEFSLS